MLSLLGLVLLAAGEVMARRAPASWSVGAAVPGALVIAVALHAPVPDWAAMTCFVAILVVTPCAVATDRGVPRLVPLLLVPTALGMWGTTPDTDHTRVLVGALLGVVLLAFDRRLPAGAGGTAVLAGIMVWSAIVDGYARRGAVVGALACFGVVVLLPLLKRTHARFTPLRVAVTIALQAAVAVIASRVAGLRDDALPSLLISMAVWAVAVGVLSVMLRSRAQDRAD
jgi:hypothetical protein